MEADSLPAVIERVIAGMSPYPWDCAESTGDAAASAVAKCRQWWRRAARAFWMWSTAGRVPPLCAFTAGALSTLYGVVAARSLSQACVAFMDAATMFVSFSWMLFAARNQSKSLRVLRCVLTLARHVEAGTRDMQQVDLDYCSLNDERVPDVHGTEQDAVDQEVASEVREATRSFRLLMSVTGPWSLAGGGLLMVSPLLTSKLTLKAWPQPDEEGGGWYWWALMLVQEVGSLGAGASLVIAMDLFLASVCGCAALARAVAARLKWCRTEEDVVRAVALHQAVLTASSRASSHVNAMLLPMAFGYLAVSLFGTYNLAAGSFSPYSAVVVPACLSFFFFITAVGEQLDSALQSVGEHAALVEVDWLGGSDAVTPGVEQAEQAVSARTARVLLLPLMSRCHRPGSASLSVAWLGPLRLEAFMRVMKRWYSALQMMLNVK